MPTPSKALSDALQPALDHGGWDQVLTDGDRERFRDALHDGVDPEDLPEDLRALLKLAVEWRSPLKEGA